MTLKRRRERDKPKFGPDALYNPNKRVLLSYASDEDGDEVEDASEQPHGDSIDPQNVANYQMDQYPAEEDEMTLGPQRPVEDKADTREPEAEDEHEQYAQQHQSKKWGSNFRRNEITNQFPQLGLVSYQWEDEDEEEEYDSATEEAMAYLRDVRSERQGIPEILTTAAQTDDERPGKSATDVDNNPTGEQDGVWKRPPSTTTPTDDFTIPQKAYTRNIVDRFFDQRRQLHLPPTAKALAELDDSYPITFPEGNNQAYAEWHRLLWSKAPRLAHLQSLDQETVFQVLELLRTRIMTPGKNIKKHVSNWIWSLLARLDDVGNMTNDQVYPLRELGKRAVLLQYSLTNPETAAQLESLESTSNPDEIPLEDLDDVDTNPDQASPSTESRNTPHPNITDNTRATLDMILVVVGEIYGQRDLLDFRTSWQPGEQTSV